MYKKNLAEEKKELMKMEEKLKREKIINKQIREERNRKIRLIMNLKVHRNFVRYVFELADEFDESVDFNVKQGDYDSMTDLLINEFEEEDEMADYQLTKVIENEDALSDKLSEIEENIVKLINNNQNMRFAQLTRQKEHKTINHVLF